MLWMTGSYTQISEFTLWVNFLLYHCAIIIKICLTLKCFYKANSSNLSENFCLKIKLICVYEKWNEIDCNMLTDIKLVLINLHKFFWKFFAINYLTSFFVWYKLFKNYTFLIDIDKSGTSAIIFWKWTLAL